MGSDRVNRHIRQQIMELNLVNLSLRRLKEALKFYNKISFIQTRLRLRALIPESESRTITSAVESIVEFAVDYSVDRFSIELVIASN